MDARRVSAVLLALTVPLSSLLGLARAMGEAGAEMFVHVWAANLWGDLVFTLGTVGAGLAVARLVARLRPSGAFAAFAAAAPASFLLHWAVYATAFTLTGGAMDQDGGAFFAVVPGNLLESFTLTLEWGLPGLLAMAFVSPALAWALGDRRPAPAPAPA